MGCRFYSTNNSKVLGGTITGNAGMGVEFITDGNQTRNCLVLFFCVLYDYVHELFYSHFF